LVFYLVVEYILEENRSYIGLGYKKEQISAKCRFVFFVDEEEI
jgi:hypothetical protein